MVSREVSRFPDDDVAQPVHVEALGHGVDERRRIIGRKLLLGLQQHSRAALQVEAFLHIGRGRGIGADAEVLGSPAHFHDLGDLPRDVDGPGHLHDAAVIRRLIDKDYFLGGEELSLIERDEVERLLHLERVLLLGGLEVDRVVHAEGCGDPVVIFQRGDGLVVDGEDALPRNRLGARLGGFHAGQRSRAVGVDAAYGQPFPSRAGADGDDGYHQKEEHQQDAPVGEYLPERVFHGLCLALEQHGAVFP